MNFKNSKIIYILASCLLVFIVYFNSLNNKFVFDDQFLVVNNPFIKSFKFLPDIFKNDIFRYTELVSSPVSQRYRPIQILTYAMDYKLWKLNPIGFHLTNILIHLLNGILTYYLLRSVFNEQIAKISGILFLVHPIHTSAVSYISGRADLLAYFFMLISMILFFKFIKQNSKIYFVISLVSTSFALLSRESALLLFLFLLLFLIYAKVRPKYFLYIAPFIVLDLLYLLLRSDILGRGAVDFSVLTLPFLMRTVNFLNIIARYLFILIFPLKLHLFRTTPYILSLSDTKAILSILCFLLALIMALRLRKNKLILFSLFWFLIGLSPVFIYMSGYDIKEAMMAESWLYVSSAGFFIFFSYVLLKFKKLGRVLIICFFIFFSFLTVVTNVYWRNDLILFTNILENSFPENYLRINLAIYYLKNSLLEDAFAEIKKISLYYPDSIHLYYLLGSYYLEKGEPGRALDNYRLALKRQKDFYAAYYYSAVCYDKLGQLDNALDFSLKCFELNPYFMPNLIKLGDLYSKKGMPKEAGQYYKKASEADPGHPLVTGKNFN